MSYHWGYLAIIGVFVALSVVVFRLSLGAYHRRYFFHKALKLAFWHTLGWFVLNTSCVCLVFWLVCLVYATSAWLATLLGWFLWWLLSQTLIAGGMRILDRLLENL